MNIMNKILVEVYIPAENKTYDVYIPVKSKLHEVTTLLVSIFSELSKGYFSASENSVLCNRDTGTIFNINLSVEELGLINGTQLMLI